MRAAPPLKRPRAASPDLLGGPGPAPADVHAQALAAHAAGWLPATTPEQRGRQRGTAGSAYGVPQDLKVFLEWGYISPNLPPPRNMRWTFRGGAWALHNLVGRG